MLVDMAGSENIEQAGQIGFEAKMQVNLNLSRTSSYHSCRFLFFLFDFFLVIELVSFYCFGRSNFGQLLFI